MSRAFTREIDDAPAAPLPERPIGAAANLVTAEGAAQIEAQLADVSARLQKVSDPAQAAVLRREQRYWAARRASMQIVPARDHPSAVGFGVTVDILRKGRRMRLRIVGEDEADPSQGRLAWTSPLARALDGAEVGDEVEFQTGGGVDIVAVLALGR